MKVELHNVFLSRGTMNSHSKIVHICLSLMKENFLFNKTEIWVQFSLPLPMCMPSDNTLCLRKQHFLVCMILQRCETKHAVRKWCISCVRKRNSNPILQFNRFLFSNKFHNSKSRHLRGNRCNLMSRKDSIKCFCNSLLFSLLARMFIRIYLSDACCTCIYFLPFRHPRLFWVIIITASRFSFLFFFRLPLFFYLDDYFSHLIQFLPKRIIFLPSLILSLQSCTHIS